MDWPILIVVVPLILVPIVLLFGFAGCSSFGSGDAAAAPANFVATATGTHSIRVDWEGATAGLVNLQVERAKLGSGFSSVGTGTQTFADNVGLDDGTSYLYQLSQSGRVVADGATATTIPEAPTILEAKGIDIDRIHISWKNNSVKADRFSLKLVPASGAGVEIFNGAATQFIHGGLTEGTAHAYRLTATEGGFDKNVSKLVESADTNFSASTLQWKTCYLRPLTLDAGDLFRTNCMVQRIQKTNLKIANGVKVRITLRTPISGGIAIAAMSISPAAVPGVALPGNPSPNPWDSAVNPTPVSLVGTPMAAPLPGVPGGILLAANSMITLNPVDYVVDINSDLIVAFDIGNPAGSSAFAAGVTGSTLFFKANAPGEALKSDRSSGPPAALDFKTRPAGEVYLVEQIDVLA